VLSPNAFGDFDTLLASLLTIIFLYFFGFVPVFLFESAFDKKSFFILCFSLRRLRQSAVVEDQHVSAHSQLLKKSLP
jgi:uncharacterized protein YqfA (UPF0365 family)